MKLKHRVQWLGVGYHYYYVCVTCPRPCPDLNIHTTFSNGCLGSHNDEERSEMRYVMRIARPRESSKF